MNSSLFIPQVIKNSASLSRPVPGWVITWATVRKNLQILPRYLPNLIGNLVEMAVRAAFFLLLSNAISIQGQEIPAGQFGGQNLYIFFLGSLVLFVFTRSALWGPINAVNNDLTNGTLEYLYSLPGSRYAYYVGVTLAEIVFSQVIFVPLFALLAVSSRANLDNLLWMLLTCAAVMVSLTAMGIMISLLALVWKQVNSIVSILGILFELLAGAYLPISSFPQAVQYVSYLLPFTWGYDLLRYYSFASSGIHWQTILPVWQEWLVLGVFAVVFTAASRFLLAKAGRLARQQGLNVI
jgi:ABC-2 type transport system permease protein